jgi:uncharacterized membrane protein
MNALMQLLQQRPVVFVHMVAALSCLALGAVLLTRRKGTTAHRCLGWAWVVAMAAVVATSLFIQDRGMPNVAGFSPIHLLSLFVAVQLPRAVMQARAGRIDAHRRTMRGLYVGGCVVAGAFTLLPGRFLGSQLWPALTGLAV